MLTKSSLKPWMTFTTSSNRNYAEILTIVLSSGTGKSKTEDEVSDSLPLREELGEILIGASHGSGM